MHASGAGGGLHGKPDCSTGYIPNDLTDGLSDGLARTDIDSSIAGSAHGDSNSCASRAFHGKSDYSTACIPDGLADGLTRTTIDSSIDGSAHDDSNSCAGRGSHGKSDRSTGCTPDGLADSLTRTSIDSSIDGSAHGDSNNCAGRGSHGKSDCSTGCIPDGLADGLTRAIIGRSIIGSARGDLNKGTGCGAHCTTAASIGTSPSGLADGLSDSFAHTGIDSRVTGIGHGSRAARQPPAPQQREDTCSTSPCSATGTWGTSLRRAPGKTQDGARARHAYVSSEAQRSLCQSRRM